VTLTTAERPRAAMAALLRTRRDEIEQAALARTFSISDATDIAEPEYLEGLRRAVSAALDYGIAAIELGDDSSLPIPGVLLEQAELAARSDVSLDTVLRRYVAGFTLFSDHVLREAEGRNCDSATLHRLLQVQAAQFDRLIAAISGAYTLAHESRFRSPEQRRAERVKRMLDGEMIDSVELNYDLKEWHLGLIAVGPGVAAAIRELADRVDRRLLLVRPDEQTVWAWLGGRSLATAIDIERLSAEPHPSEITIAIGEPAADLAGWRLTHRQAKAALVVGLRRRQRFVRYADVAISAAAAQDEVLTTSLRHLYLDPLAEEEDSGTTLLETLRAYFAAGRSVSSAAAILGVSRQTVGIRIRMIEERLGRRLESCALEIEVALRVDGFGPCDE
jgi:hypothetical protein